MKKNSANVDNVLTIEMIKHTQLQKYFQNISPEFKVKILTSDAYITHQPNAKTT